ncbi:MAG: hypothetical protein Q9179_005720 [Wetmoreana sp. 5 TL-2023]
MASSLPPGISLDMIPSAKPPKGVQPNFSNPVTLETTVIAVSAVTSALAVVLLCTRLYSTIRVTRSAWYDDVAVVSAIVFSLAYVGLIIDTRGYAKHSWDVPLSVFTPRYYKKILAESIIGALGLLFSKISILLLLHRLFGPDKRFRYYVYFGMLWATAISCTTITASGALCAPRAGESFGDLRSAQRCDRLKIWAVVQGSLNVILDLYILYIPLPVIWKLQMGQKKKIGVAAIFMTGLM